jgi:hypothetical protein
MGIVHLITGKEHAETLRENLRQSDLSEEEILIFKDLLNFGPLKSENLTYAENRNAFWNTVSPEQQPVDDLERLMQLSTRLSNGEDLQLWFWMAATAADICTYFWLLHFLKKHQGKLSVINIAGLPFLDEAGKLFYPECIGDLPGKELMKARKLVRKLTASEWETEGEEWKNMVTENAVVRVLKAGKALEGKPMDYFDDSLLAVASEGSKKVHKIIQETKLKNKLPHAGGFLSWRLQQLMEEGKINLLARI